MAAMRRHHRGDLAHPRRSVGWRLIGGLRARHTRSTPTRVVGQAINQLHRPSIDRAVRLADLKVSVKALANIADLTPFLRVSGEAAIDRPRVGRPLGELSSTRYLLKPASSVSPPAFSTPSFNSNGPNLWHPNPIKPPAQRCNGSFARV